MILFEEVKKKFDDPLNKRTSALTIIKKDKKQPEKTALSIEHKSFPEKNKKVNYNSLLISSIEKYFQTLDKLIILQLNKQCSVNREHPDFKSLRKYILDGCKFLLVSKYIIEDLLTNYLNKQKNRIVEEDLEISKCNEIVKRFIDLYIKYGLN